MLFIESKKNCDVNLGIHLIFGLPGEKKENLIETAKMISILPIDNVKLHNLHVLKGTPLADQYLQGKFSPVSRERIRGPGDSLCAAPESTDCHSQIGGCGQCHGELVAPEWVKSKMATYQFFLDEFSRVLPTKANIAIAFQKKNLGWNPEISLWKKASKFFFWKAIIRINNAY